MQKAESSKSQILQNIFQNFWQESVEELQPFYCKWDTNITTISGDDNFPPLIDFCRKSGLKNQFQDQFHQFFLIDLEKIEKLTSRILAI